MKTELYILQVLQYDVNIPTVHCFVHQLAATLPGFNQAVSLNPQDDPKLALDFIVDHVTQDLRVIYLGLHRSFRPDIILRTSGNSPSEAH